MTTHTRRVRAQVGPSVGLLLLAAFLMGCGGSAATAPANTLALSPAPAESSTPGASPTASPSPTPDVLAQAAQAYLALATKLNAETAAVGTLSTTATLAEVKAFYASLAAIQADGVAGIQAITFPTRMKDDVENLIRATNAVRTAEASIAASASLAQVSAGTESLGSAFDAMGRAANNLREHLGLPAMTAALPPPSLRPTPRPTPGPTAVPSIDPTADMVIASPFSLEPMDPETLAQLQAQLTAAVGALAPAFRVGARWVNQGTEHVALLMVMEVPGFGGAITSPAVLDQVAAGMTGSAGQIQTTSILGVPVRLGEKLGSPIGLYVQGEDSIAIVVGLTAMEMDSLKSVVTALLKARS